MGFWRTQPFDLRLPSIDGKTPLGNCDMCFLKSAATIQAIMRDQPHLADRWIEQERRMAGQTRTPSVAVCRRHRRSRRGDSHGTASSYKIGGEEADVDDVRAWGLERPRSRFTGKGFSNRRQRDRRPRHSTPSGPLSSGRGRPMIGSAAASPVGGGAQIVPFSPPGRRCP
jgi:hypothetical protein